MRDPRIETWLDATIADLWPGARRESLAEVAGDASSRVYARASLSGSQQGGDSCPSSVVLMILQDAGVAMSSDELGVFAEGGPDELPFVNVLRFMARSCAAVPRLYAVSDSCDLLLLEDLAPARRLGNQVAGCTREEAAAALRHVAAVHLAWWEHPDLETLAWAPPVNILSRYVEVMYRKGLGGGRTVWNA